jgi:glucose/arabinose dehydrogenase
VAATLASAVVTLAACGGDTGSSRGAGSPDGRESVATSTTGQPSTTAAADACDTPPAQPSGPPGRSVFVSDVDFATALAWAPDGRLFMAERSGTVKIASGGSVRDFVRVPTTTSEPSGFGYSERGLLGLALSPSFPTDHFVYAFYSEQDGVSQAIVRFTECAGEARDETRLVTLPAGDDCCHKGGRLAFGPDGKLYATLGDEHGVTSDSVDSPTSVPQDPRDPRGKILRYEPDGTIPADNPFGADSPVWVAGLRNPFGIAFGGGEVFVTSNGPTGDVGTPRTGYDLAFRVRAGATYQWPACYGYSHLVPGASSCLGRAEPEWSSEEATAIPTGATWVDERGPSGYASHFVFCSSTGMRIFTPGTPHATAREGADDCLLDVKQGPDGALYFSDSTAIHRLAAD